MVRKLDICGKCGAYDFRGQQTIWPLPHQQQARGRCLLEGEHVREVKIRIEKDEFSSWLAEQQGVRDLAPAGMSMSERTLGSKHVRFPIHQLRFRRYTPSVTRVHTHCCQRFEQRLLVRVTVRNQM
jgi:hypothetical protein